MLRNYLKLILPDGIKRVLFDGYYKTVYFLHRRNYRGEGKICPLCGKQYKKFLTYSSRKNALCPNCLSLERERLLYLYLKNNTDIFTGSNSLLHVAPEKSLQKILRSNKRLENISVDKNSSLAKIKADLQSLPFKNNQFDYLICSYVLEHVENDFLALKEIRRVIKRNGTALIMVTLSRIKKTIEGKFPDSHLRMYGKDFIARLKENGFKVKIFDACRFGSKVIEKNALLPTDRIFILTK